jgi:hypothetical protein
LCTTSDYPVDPTKCVPQLQSTTACGGYPCQWTVQLPCEFEDAGTVDDAGNIVDAGDVQDAAIPRDVCYTLCAPYIKGQPWYGCWSMPTADGRGVIAYCGGCVGGRAPRGFVPRRAVVTSPVAARLALMAQLEDASVAAFRALHDDLARHGAPRSLLRAVRAAERDEIRHARVVGRAAERFGASIPRASVAPMTARSLEQLAIENAEEGCVKETFGAAVASLQAERASDPRLRSMMRAIAGDELEHAALAWRVAGWLDARLDPDARERVRRARAAALATLREELASDEPAHPVLGLPDARTLRALLDGMREALVGGDLTARAAA